jgi:biotin synthase-like enzyme
MKTPPGAERILTMKSNGEYAAVLDRALDRAPTLEEACFLLENASGPEATTWLFAAASEVRKREAGDVFQLDGFMGGTTKCVIDPPCLYCRRAISGHDLEPWTAEPEELPLILEAFKETGTTTVEIGGGTDPEICAQVGLNLLREIRKSGLKVRVNYGPALNRDEILAMKELGVEGITCSFETTNPGVFRTIKPGDSLEKRKETAALISECGVNLFNTMLVGVGESLRDRVDHLFCLKEIPGFYKLSVSWLKVHPDGPLDGKMTGPSPLEAARAAALARLIFREKPIGLSGAQYIQLSILAGANRMVHAGASLRKEGGFRIGSAGFLKVETRPVAKGLVLENLLPITASWVKAAGMEVEPSVAAALAGSKGGGE